MSKHEELLRVMYLSGTISIPPKLPGVAEITFQCVGKKDSRTLVEATQKVSPKVTIKRSFFIEDVMSMYVPHKDSPHDPEQGQWYEDAALDKKANKGLGKPAFDGVIYVRENAQSMLEVQAGLTAAESAEYYPPLPNDRSVNHYNMDQSTDVFQKYGGPGCPF